MTEALPVIAFVALLALNATAPEPLKRIVLAFMWLAGLGTVLWALVDAAVRLLS